MEYHSWWKTKYASVVKKLSNYKMVDFSNDPRVHCFSEMIVGLKIHGELTVDSKLMHNGRYFVTCCRFGLAKKCLNLKLTCNIMQLQEKESMTSNHSSAKDLVIANQFDFYRQN